MRTLKYAWRFLMRSKSYTIINLLGLAFSLACSIILIRYIHRELTVDAHSVDPEHIIIPYTGYGRKSFIREVCNKIGRKRILFISLTIK